MSNPIRKITIEVVEPKNVLVDENNKPLPLDMQDYSRGPVCFGGTTYIVETNEFTFMIQREKELWYEPCYQISHGDLVTLIHQLIDIEVDMKFKFQ